MGRLLGLLVIFVTLGMPRSASAGPLDDAAVAYERGDYATVITLLRPFAEQGNKKAQYTLGVMYAQGGRGVPQDYKEAVKWYRLSAAQGNAEAQSSLGLMYHEGKGVPLDYKEAVKWYGLAAAQGDAMAQGLLGFIYYNGRGVPQDYVRAHMWFNLAAASLSGEDGKQLIEYRHTVAAKMTPAHIAQAQEMARKCQASNFKQCD